MVVTQHTAVHTNTTGPESHDVPVGVITMSELECNYDNCTETFDNHDSRLEHSMSEHTDLNPKKYPTLIGSDSGLKF